MAYMAYPDEVARRIVKMMTTMTMTMTMTMTVKIPLKVEKIRQG